MVGTGRDLGGVSVLIPMAAEHDSDSVEPPGSEALLDAVLRTLYDLGERSSWEEAAKDSETHPEAAGPRPTWSPGAMSASATLSGTFSPTCWPTFCSPSHCAGK